MHVRIFQEAKSAMTSGRGKTGTWVLEPATGPNRMTDPLMGWSSVDGSKGQFRLEFGSADEAVAYANREGFTFEVEPAKKRERLVKSYAKNFDADRKQAWTH